MKKYIIENLEVKEINIYRETEQYVYMPGGKRKEKSKKYFSSKEEAMLFLMKEEVKKFENDIFSFQSRWSRLLEYNEGILKNV